jgi:hypothetical protein
MTVRDTDLHPSIEDLALFSRGDLNRIAGWRTARHVRHCAKCEDLCGRFRAAVEEVQRRASQQSLTGFEASANWGRLEREMVGNIKVGLAAAACIEHVPHRTFHGWRGAAAVAGLSLVFVTGWWMNVPRRDTEKVVTAIRTAFTPPQSASGTILQTTSDGIAVRSQGAMLTLLHPSASDVTVSVNGTSSVGARYVDDETGQITITNVYAQ